MTKLQAPADACSPCTIEGGKEYAPDANGIVTVDNPAHEAVLRQHGYTDVRGALDAARSGAPHQEPKPADDGDNEDEFDGMTKAEMIDWLEERDREDDIPNKPKLGALQELCRKVKAELAENND